ncbi:hypothetical protein K439DRAFT_1348218, partial [Ramaria rubella]
VNSLADLKAAKTDIISHHNCPILPDGLWTDILANHFVDLDKVHTGYYMLKADYKHTQSIGDVDITLNSAGPTSKAARAIVTHGKWAITFRIAERAILFAYLHRADELFEYKEFIIGHFTAMDDIATHYKVINLDKAIRSNSFSLIAYDKFNDLISWHLVSNNSLASRPAGPK